MTKTITYIFSVCILITGLTRNLDAADSVNRLSFYRDNYCLSGFNDNLQGRFDDRDNQIKYQISVKYLLDFDIGTWLSSDFFDLYFTYTQNHFWNFYDKSSPFKEINFSPSWMFSFKFNNKFIYSADLHPFLHESNGREGFEDRSWNRLMINLGIAKYQYLSVNLSGWYIYRINLSDNNRDINEYSGYFELLARLSDNVDDPMIHMDYILRKGKKGWTNIFNIKWALLNFISERASKSILLYVQLYTGYIESLELYNIKEKRIRIGIGLI